MAKAASEQLPEPSAPVNTIESQNSAVSEVFNLSDRVLISSDFNVSHALFPLQREGVVAERSAGLFEVSHDGARRG
jgi:hypothetical protein